MKKSIIIFLLAVFAAYGHAMGDPISSAEEMFRTSQYKEGMAILKKSLKDRNVKIELYQAETKKICNSHFKEIAVFTCNIMHLLNFRNF